MATRKISTKLQLDGEAEYRASLKNINSELGTLKSELKLTESQFAGHLNSYAALSAKGETLAGMYDQQEKKLAAINKILSEAKDAQSKFGNEVQSAKDKIAKTEAALNALADAEGDTSEQQAKLTAELEEYKTELATAEANQQKATEAVNKYQTQANSAEAELNKLGNEIDENNKCMDKAAKSSDKCADSVDKYSGKVKKADEDTEKFSEKLKTGLVAGATAAAAAFAAISAAAVKLGVEVVTAYADYEQLVGGVETLFQDSSGKVLDYANNAYKTAGLSANEYMETVTSFSASLLSSLGGDTEKAADYADKAITDMSDNANKMGSDMDSIMNAYKGFSKQTFTMLDNLKLGYGGTKEEMQRLLDDAEKISGIKYDISSYADIVDAIHVIQTEMGITGTTAKEAEETISGSIGMLKTSFQNLITGMGDADANIDQLCDNVVNSFKSVVKNISPVIQNLAKTIPNAMEGILDAISPLIPEFLELGVNLFEALLNGIIDMLPELSSTAAELITTLITGIVEALPLVVEAAAHLHTPAGYAHLLQPLHQQAALMIGKKGLDQSVGREIVHQSLHIPLRPRLPGEVEQIEHLRHRRIPPFSHSRRGLPIRVSHSTGNRRGNQPAFQTAKARRSCGGPLCFDFPGRSRSALRQGFASQNACTRRRRGALARPVAREGPVELRPPLLTGSS